MAEAETVAAQQPLSSESVGNADIVIGLATYNNADTIGNLVRAVVAGLPQHFPSKQSVLVHLDGGSEDATVQLVREAADSTVPLIQDKYVLDKFLTPAHGLPGHVSAARGIFQSAEKLGAAACLLLDATTQNVAADSIHALLRPVVEQGFDMAVPYFRRHRYEGGVSNGIVAPMIRALYGKRLRQPLGSEFALSGRLAGQCVKLETQNGQPAQCSVDIWLVIEAICGNYRICQVFLGEKPERAKAPSADPSEILVQLLSALFTATGATVATWQKARGSEAIPSFGGDAAPSAEPSAQVNVKRMIEAFRLGYQTLQEIWGLLLPPATLLELKKLTIAPDEQFRMADDLWARIVYDFALGYRLRPIARDHLLRALTPLYLGWLASFIQETERSTPMGVEARLERLGFAYETQKHYLISRWRWPDRFNP